MEVWSWPSLIIIRTSSISKIQPYHKHHVLWFVDPLHDHSSPETQKQTRNYHSELFCSQKWKSQIQFSGFMSRRTLFCQGTLRFEKQVHWRWYHQHTRVSSRQHFRGLWGKGFPTDSRHSNGHKLCPSPIRHISVLKRSGIHTVLTLNWKEKKIASQFNFTYRYIDNVLSINDPDFENYLGQMYTAELEIKDTTESNTSASYLDLLQSIESDGQLRTSLFDKRDDFNFHIINFPFLSSNIPSSQVFSVFISQLIRYARACSSYECFILRAARLSSKLLGQGYVM